MKNTTFILLAFLFLVGGLFFAYVDRSTKIPIVVGPGQNNIFPKKLETKETAIFLGNSALNPNAIDCAKVFSVNRRIEDLPSVATLTIEKLLAGPNELEKMHGYYTSLEGSKLNSINIIDGTAIIDFENLPSGGSCLVTQARAQIESTLLQFETINEVVISVNGDSTDVLQP